MFNGSYFEQNRVTHAAVLKTGHYTLLLDNLGYVYSSKGWQNYLKEKTNKDPDAKVLDLSIFSNIQWNLLYRNYCVTNLCI